MKQKPTRDVNVKVDETKATEIITALTNLKRHPGWKILIENLDINIKAVEKIILDGNDKMTAEELQMWRDRRYYQMKLKETPDKIIEKIQRGELGEPIELDPYPYKT